MTAKIEQIVRFFEDVALALDDPPSVYVEPAEGFKVPGGHDSLCIFLDHVAPHQLVKGHITDELQAEITLECHRPDGRASRFSSLLDFVLKLTSAIEDSLGEDETGGDLFDSCNAAEGNFARSQITGYGVSHAAFSLSIIYRGDTRFI